MRRTHTYVTMDVTPTTFNDIKAQHANAGYTDRFEVDDNDKVVGIYMGDIMLVVEKV